jgi:DUF4097 and DUF4098 domain-containing protein YvlB
MKQLFFFAALTAMLCCTTMAGESARERVTKSFTVAKGGDLEMDLSGGDIHLVPWEKDEVVVTVDGLPDAEKEFLKITQSGGTISVDFRPKWGNSGDLKFIVNHPSHFNARIHTSGGDLVVEGKIVGRLNGSTSGGDIRTESVDGPALLKTSGGDVTLGTINGEADVKTSGGNITIASVAKRLKASTSGGDVHVGDIGGEAELSTAGGDVRVGNVSGKASLKTAGGSIDLASAAGSADVKTAGGNIELRKITGSINAKTAGGNIDAELIPGSSAASELTTAAGDVRLAVPANAKATIDATIRMKNERHHSSGEYTIHSDFDAASATSGEGGDEVHNVYKLNGGGTVITVRTMNGNIYIKKITH